ncbi:MAG: pilus assembly protein PilM [Oscillospiraceae bacterium]|nr:pilus assembly protein PilM [Oscillospiraceae bacterium]
MLSFDITDRNIRIIKGTENGGKIKISAAANLDLEEAVIVNGHVNDINRVAMMINQVLKQNNMPDKEAIVSISSNQTVFKELLIPPNSKESEFMKSVRHELQMQINVDDSYAVGYLIVGEPEEDEHGERVQRILATACPYDVVDCYKRIFHMLGISLKTVMIGCNAITKVLLADVKVKSLMPLLAVQIDKNFISLNLYEDNQLSFSRFASIDPEDYENPDDYVFEAVNENIFRMIQFARSRGSEAISNVVFYGDITASPNLYNRLVDEMENNEINVSQLNVPPQIHGYQNLEFSLYANAIGAMFKRNKITEHVNLLDAEGASALAGAMKNKTEGGVPVLPIIGLVVSLVGVLGLWAGFSILDSNVKKETQRLRDDINSPETAAKLQQYEDLKVMRETVNNYGTIITNTSEAYKTLPIVTRQCYEAVDTTLKTVMEQNPGTTKEAEVATFNFENGLVTIPIVIETTDEFAQKYPAMVVEHLYTEYKDMFADVSYESYSVNAAASEAQPGMPTTEVKEISFSLTMKLQPNEKADLERDQTEETTEAAS